LAGGLDVIGLFDGDHQILGNQKLGALAQHNSGITFATTQQRIHSLLFFLFVKTLDIENNIELFFK
jgi:hypothetical protein